MLSKKRIAVVCPARLGDTLFCTPAIAFLKKHRPDAVIDVLTVSELSASIFQHNPVIHQTHVIKNHEGAKSLAENYDLVINLHDNEDTHQITKMLKLPSISIPAKDETLHQAEQALQFIALQLNYPVREQDRFYQLFPQQENIDHIKKLLITKFTLQCKIAVLHLGCHSIAKRPRWKIWQSKTHEKVWPIKNFITLAKQLKKQNPDLYFVVTGTKSEKELANTFLAKIPYAFNLIDQTSVLDTAALMQTFANVFITSDTGPMHVACATDVNLVALFGPTSLTRTGPYPVRKNHTILQRPSMDDIDVASVYNAVMKYL